EGGVASIVFPAEAGHGLGQQVIAAQSDGWMRQPLQSEAATKGKSAVVKGKPAVAAEGKASASRPALAGAARAQQEAGGGEESLRERSIAYFRKLVASTLKKRPEQIEAQRPLSQSGGGWIL